MYPITTRAAMESLLVEPGPWTLDELATAMHVHRNTIQDAIGELERAGLANRISDNFVCASRAAIVADELTS